MEYEYVEVRNEVWLKTNFINVNVPKGAITGLPHAMMGRLIKNEGEAWLGVTSDKNISDIKEC